MCVLCYFFNIILHTFPNIIFILIIRHMAFYRFTLNLSLEVAEDFFSQGCFPRRVFKNWNYRWNDVSEWSPKDSPIYSTSYQFWVCTSFFPPYIALSPQWSKKYYWTGKGWQKSQMSKSYLKPSYRNNKMEVTAFKWFCPGTIYFFPKSAWHGKILRIS